MATKTFKTQFLLGAKYTGGSAFGALNRDIDRTQRNAKQTSNVFGGIFGKAGSIAVAVGGTIAAFEGLRKAIDIGKWAFDAAKTQKKAHDVVRQSNQRLVAEGRLQSKDMEKRTQETIAFAEAMNKAGGLDAETLEVGLAGLNKYLDSKQIKAMANGWQDWMVKIHKGAPTIEEAASDQDNLNKYILSGKKAFLTSMGLTKEQTDAIAKQVKGHDAASRAQSRAAIVAKTLGKETGETARWMETDEGKAYQMENAAEDLGETLGGPAVAAQREMNIALTDLYKALGPVAELIAKEMTPAIQTFTTWIKDNKENIVKWGEMAVTTVTKVFNGFWWLQAQSESFFKPIADNSIREWNNIVAGATKAWEGVKEIWGLASGWFSELAIKIGEAIAPVYDWIIKPFKAAFEWIIKNDPAKGYIPPTGGGFGGGGGGEEGDYVPDWQDKGAVLENSGGWGTPMNPKIQKVSNAGLAKTRAQYAQEMANDPAAKAKFYAKVKAEVGNQGLDAIQKQMETMENRAYLRNLTAKEVASQGGKAGRYWGSGYKRLSADEQKVYDLAAAGVHAGSNKARLATGNESSWLRNGRVVATSKGERFVVEPADVKKHKKLREAAAKAGGDQASIPDNAYMKDPRRQGINRMIKDINVNQRVSGATGGQSVAMNSPITINGVPTGKEMAVARAARRAIQDPIRAGLDQMKEMKKAEDRGTYV